MVANVVVGIVFTAMIVFGASVLMGIVTGAEGPSREPGWRQRRGILGGEVLVLCGVLGFVVGWVVP